MFSVQTFFAIHAAMTNAALRSIVVARYEGEFEFCLAFVGEAQLKFAFLADCAQNMGLHVRVLVTLFPIPSDLFQWAAVPVALSDAALLRDCSASAETISTLPNATAHLVDAK